MVSRMRAVRCAATSRSCQPLTIMGLEAPSATSTSQPVSDATELAPSAIATGVRTLMGSGPSLQPQPRRAHADGGGQREGVEGGHLADPQPGQPRLTGRRRDLAAPPRRGGPARTAASTSIRRGHSIATSAGWSEQDAAGQLARCLVDLEMGGGGERVAESALQRRAVVNGAAAGKVIHRAHHVGGRSAPRAWPQAAAGCALRPARGLRLDWPAKRFRSPGSTAPARPPAPTRPSRPPPGSVGRSASVRVDAEPLLGAGQIDEVVDRGARIAHRGRGDAGGEEPERREAVQRPVDRSGRRISRTPVGPARRPHRPPCRGCRCRAGRACARCRGSRSSSVGSATTDGTRRSSSDAPGEQHVGVGDSAAERPAARHHDAAGDRPGRAARRPHTGGDAAPVAEQCVAAELRQIGDQQAAGDRDRHAPAGRRIAACHRFGAPQRRRQAAAPEPRPRPARPRAAGPNHAAHQPIRREVCGRRRSDLPCRAAISPISRARATMSCSAAAGKVVSVSVMASSASTNSYSAVA